MEPERWGQIERLDRLALEQEPDNRFTFLAAACGGDEELRGELESLLAASRFTGAMLEANLGSSSGSSRYNNHFDAGCQDRALSDSQFAR